MRSAARRDEVANYRLEMIITDPDKRSKAPANENNKMRAAVPDGG